MKKISLTNDRKGKSSGAMNMKKIIITLILLTCIIGTTACRRETPADTSAPQSSESRESTEKEDNTTELVSELTPFEKMVRENEGRMLPPEEVEKWNDYFGNQAVNLMLRSSYETSAEIDLHHFVDCPMRFLTRGEAEKISEEEWQQLESLFPELWSVKSIMPIFKNSEQLLNEILLQYMGITLEETEKRGLENIPWLEGYRAYYYASGDGGNLPITPAEAAKMPDGTLLIHWKEKETPWGFLEGIGKLKEQDDRWLIEFNQVIGS